MSGLNDVLERARGCALCASALPLGPRPVLQAHASASILIASQAPRRKVHVSGIPFQDPSGVRLREWMGVTEEEFYDERVVAILPMGFCYPGSGSSGDLPPRPECAPAWRDPILAELRSVRLTLVLGRYALAYHLDNEGTVTDAVSSEPSLVQAASLVRARRRAPPSRAGESNDRAERMRVARSGLPESVVRRHYRTAW